MNPPLPKGRSTGLSFIDLFSGGGGLSMGFEQAGFRSIYAADWDRASCDTYHANFGHDVHCGDIADLRKVPDAEILVGGPPCQGFSPLGKMIPREEHAEMNKLWREYFRILDLVEPRAFVIENVPEFRRSPEFKHLERAARKRGYEMVSDVLNAHHYGVPQLRRRAIVIGVREGEGVPFMPAPVPLKARTTVRDAIGDLPLAPTGEDWHVGRDPRPESIERYKCVPPGGNRFDLMRKRPDITPRCWLNKKTGSTDVFGRLEWDKPSLTIRTEFYKPEKGRYLHPEAHRPITHREAARLQTFPDDFVFLGSKVEVARIIGNAVPPRLAYHVARAVADALAGKTPPHALPAPLAR